MGRIMDSIIKKQKISIVVPVYNVDKYLKRCIDSLVAQTYDNYEIILVDDGSTDCCPSICDEYYENYPFVKVFHKENGGLSDARNYGVNKSDSKYIVFVDSDDVVDDNMLDLLMDAKLRTGADIVCSPLIYEFAGGKSKAVISFNENVVDGVTAQSYILRSKYSGTAACGKLFPREILEKNPYPVGKINEELRTTFWHFENVSHIAFIPNAFYHYIQRGNSITHENVTIQTTMEAIEVCDGFIQYSKNIKVTRACVNRIYRIAGDYCTAHSTIPRETRIEIQKRIRRYLPIAIGDDDNTVVDKIKFLLLSFCDFSFRIFMYLQRKNRERYANDERYLMRESDHCE